MRLARRKKFRLRHGSALGNRAAAGFIGIMKTPRRPVKAPTKVRKIRVAERPPEPPVRISASEYLAATETPEERTARLRALRLAREARERASAAEPEGVYD